MYFQQVQFWRKSVRSKSEIWNLDLHSSLWSVIRLWSIGKTTMTRHGNYLKKNPLLSHMFFFFSVLVILYYNLKKGKITFPSFLPFFLPACLRAWFPHFDNSLLHMKIYNNCAGICSFCINKELMGASLYIFCVYFQLRNRFADKTLEKILRLEKSRKIWKLDSSLRVLVLQVLNMPNYNDYCQTLLNYLPALKLTKMTQTMNCYINIFELLLTNSTATH